MSERNKQRLIEAIQASNGNVSEACRMVGVSRRTFYNYLDTDNAFAAEVESVTEAKIDLVEDKLFEKIEEGNLPAIIYFLKTKGKERGYSAKASDKETKLDRMFDFT